jgi:hypothetical protein
VASAAGREGIRRSEKAKVPEEASPEVQRLREAVETRSLSGGPGINTALNRVDVLVLNTVLKRLDVRITPGPRLLIICLLNV